MNRKFIILFLSFVLISCETIKRSYVLVDEKDMVKKTIAIASFTIPKNMTNEYRDKLKYLNTEIYADFILNSFISNFNSQNELFELKTLKDAIGDEEFAKLPNHYILGTDYVAATGTLASTNFLDDNTINLLIETNISGIMNADAIISFWSQNIKVNFKVYDTNKNNLWVDNLNGYSYYIIGDTGSPTRQTAYEIVIADILKSQERHSDDLYIIIDEAISNGVVKLKNKIPYAFNTNNILFTQKTFSLTNEEYSKKAGIN